MREAQSLAGIGDLVQERGSFRYSNLLFRCVNARGGHGLQDEMLALQRINSYTFLVGYLGFLATWILDTVYSLLHRAGVKATDDAIKTTLRAMSPHYALARSATASIPTAETVSEECLFNHSTRRVVLRPFKHYRRVVAAASKLRCRKFVGKLVEEHNRRTGMVCAWLAILRSVVECRGIYEVTETYGEERGEPNTSPWPWEAAGQHMAWLAVQAAGQCPSCLPNTLHLPPTKSFSTDHPPCSTSATNLMDQQHCRHCTHVTTESMCGGTCISIRDVQSVQCLTD